MNISNIKSYIKYASNSLFFLFILSSFTSASSPAIHDITKLNPTPVEWETIFAGIETDTLFTVDGQKILGTIELKKKGIILKSAANKIKYDYAFSEIHKIHYSNGTQKLYNPLNADVKSKAELDKQDIREKKALKVLVAGALIYILLSVLAFLLFLLFLFAISRG